MGKLTIGVVARETGVPVRTIRFYEAEGVLPRPPRTRAGYRTYSPKDIRRLILVRNARLLGLPLPEVRALVEQAFSAECQAFAPQIRALITNRRADVKLRIAEMRQLLRELDELEEHVSHAECTTTPGQLVAECGFCPMIDEETEPAT